MKVSVSFDAVLLATVDRVEGVGSQCIKRQWDSISKMQRSVISTRVFSVVRFQFPGALAYNVSKAALDQLTRCSALGKYCTVTFTPLECPVGMLS